MATRWQLTVVAMCTLLATPSAHADIYRWDTREVIPGTDEIWWLGDGAELDHMELEFAALMDRGLRSANFEESNLRGAWMSRSWLNNANLSAVNLADADLENADLTDANLTGANLTNAYLRSSRLTNANLTGANLTNADLLYAATDGTDLSGAVVIEALFGGWGLTQEQLYSTASYQTKNLQGVGFSGVDLTGWDFSGQDLTNGGFASCWLTDVDMSGAIVTGATLIPAGAEHFTKEQLYSTASYQAKNLRRVDLSFNDVTGWDFSGQDLTNGGFYATTLTSANLTGANLRNVDFRRAIGNLQSAILDSTTIYNQWTRFPSEFDPAEAGMTLVPSPTGDLNADDALDMTDVDWLTNRILERFYPRLPAAVFDLNGDSKINSEDHHVWVKDLKHTWFGDANFDGEFDSSDMVQVFAAGKYEAGWADRRGNIHDGAGWAEGDWNADGIFDSRDMVTAFVDGGYEKGPRTDAVAVPEPGGWVLLVMGAMSLLTVRQRC